MSCVYQHIRLDKNTPFYIGVGASVKRAYSKYGRNNIWKRIVAKVGYRVEIIIDRVSREDALKEEKRLIAVYGRMNNNTGVLANLTDGGDGGSGIVRSEESRNRLSEMYKERCKFDRSMIEPMHAHNRGKHLSEETKRKLSESKKGRRLTEEHKAKLRGRPSPAKRPEVRKKLSELFKGRPIPEEQKRRISETLKGKSNGPWKLAQYEKNRQYWESVYHPITQLSLDGKIVKVWNNRLIASRTLNIPKNDIRECARGRRKEAGGFIFRFGDMLKG